MRKPVAVTTTFLLAVLLAFGSAAGSASAMETASTALQSTQASSAESRQEIIAVLNGINKFRKDKGLKPLRIGANASAVSQEWSKHMADQDLLVHSSTYYADPRIESDWVEAAENIAMASSGGGAKLVDGWIKSPGHNANMSNPGHNVLGVGVSFDRQGRIWGSTSFYNYPTLPARTYATAEEFLDAAEPAPVFLDVPSGSAFDAEIRWMAARGITTGWPDGTYRPLDTVRRDAMAAFLYRLSGSTDFTPAKTSPFKDVSTGQQFYLEMSWLSDTQVSTGWPDGTYRSGEAVNRDAMAAFLFRMSGPWTHYVPPRQSYFADVSPSDPFYKEISWMADMQISTGWTTGSGIREYRPTQPVNRDAMAAFMYRFDKGGWV